MSTTDLLFFLAFFQPKLEITKEQFNRDFLNTSQTSQVKPNINLKSTTLAYDSRELFKQRVNLQAEKAYYPFNQFPASQLKLSAGEVRVKLNLKNDYGKKKL